MTIARYGSHAFMHNPYDLIADRWHAAGREFRHRRYVDMTVEGLSGGARILDLGCGTGRPVAEYLAGRGFDVTGVDDSESMLEIARRLLPDAQFVRGDMVDVKLEGRFEAAVVWDSLFHVGRSRHREVFRKLSGWLRPGGRLLMSAGGSGDEGFTSEMFGQEFFYSAWEPEETLSLLRGERFEVNFWEVDEPYSRGHIAVLARRVP